MKKESISAEEFDRIFDEGEEDVVQYFDETTWRRPNKNEDSTTVMLPDWMAGELDKRAKNAEVSRQTIIVRLLEGQLRKASV